MLQELAELVAGADQEVGIAVHVNDEVDRLEQHGVLGVAVLHLLRLGRLLRLVENRLQTFRQPRLHGGILCCCKFGESTRVSVKKSYLLAEKT